jgi:hypothetical protein
MIILSKDKIIYRRSRDSRKKTEVSALIPYLRENIEIEGTFTLEDLFKIIEKEKDLFNSIFMSDNGLYKIDPFIEEIKKDAPDEDIDMDFLCLWWAFELENDIGYEEDDDDDEYDEGNEFFLNPLFGGEKRVFYEEDALGGPEEIDEGRNICYRPINEVKNVPIRIEEDFEAQVMSKGKHITLFKCYKKFTVYEFLKGIFEEITFCGSPQKQEEKLKFFSNDLERIEKEMSEEDKIDFLCRKSNNTNEDISI